MIMRWNEKRHTQTQSMRSFCGKYVLLPDSGFELPFTVSYMTGTDNGEHMFQEVLNALHFSLRLHKQQID